MRIEVSYINARKHYLQEMDEIAHKEFNIKKKMKVLHKRRKKLMIAMDEWDNKLMEV